MPAAVSEVSQAASSTYRLPPADVVKIVDAEVSPQFRFSPDRRRMMLATYPALPSIEMLSQPRLRLAGVRIHPDRSAKERTRFYEKVTVIDIDGPNLARVVLKTPKGARLGFPSWSPDGRHLALTVTRDDGVELWVASVATGEAQKLGERDLNASLSRGFAWMPDSRGLLVRLVPSQRGPAPQKPRVPSGPSVLQTARRKATNRTYQDLLSNAHDDALFTHYARSQLARIALDGTVEPVGQPGIFLSASVSPDGVWLLVRRVHAPYSRIVPYGRFPFTTEVMRFDGTMFGGTMAKTLSEAPLAEEIPIEGVRTGMRWEHWLPTEPASIVHAEALDGGDPNTVAPFRDRLFIRSAPFNRPSRAIGDVEHRLRGIDWLQTQGQYLLTEYDRDKRWIKTTLRHIDNKTPGRVFDDRSVHDRYGDPGDPLYRRLPNGEWVVQVLGGAILLRAAGASPTGDRPFMDLVPLDGSPSSRLFQAPEKGRYERVVGLMGGDPKRLIVRRESPTAQPNYLVIEGQRERAITAFPHPHPQLSRIDKQLVTYERKDGLPLWSELYLPPNRKAGERVPLVMWAYPRSYKDKRSAGQTRVTPTRFTRLAGTSPLMFLTQGYAVAFVAMPVVGDPKSMNDTFIAQITSDAEAAIEALHQHGAIDRRRIGIGGHSYGAFMVVNLLAHTDLFRAGIARSGAYNRSLTPFGFQRERRTLWDATDVYVKVSPLFHADKIDEPLLMTHGEIDSNSGTFPLQSKRLFHAMSGLGGTARLVLLPNESHGYRARESVLHVLAESFAWFDEHVKQPPRTSDSTDTAN